MPSMKAQGLIIVITSRSYLFSIFSQFRFETIDNLDGSIGAYVKFPFNAFHEA